MIFKNGSRNACVSIPSEIELDVALSASTFNVFVLAEDLRGQCDIAAVEEAERDCSGGLYAVKQNLKNCQ